MGTGKNLYATVLEQIRRNSIINALAQYAYLKVGLALMSRPKVKSGSRLTENERTQKPRVAFLCDEMTWRDFQDCCEAVFLHPKTYRQQLKELKPDMFFCESAWSGIDAYPGVWRGRVYRDKRVSFENRDLLLDILDYCKKCEIPTAFWNKEDPTYFDHDIYDFTDTALRFDYVFTTAQECIARYQQRGHQHVFLLPFGVNTNLFYPEPETQKRNAAVFAGSWFGDHPSRCEALAALLDYVLDQGWELVIYDRYSAAPEARYRFPEKYLPYIRPAVPFSRMPEICRKYEYAINVNTVVDSPTMISRRVLQLAASGVKIISNETMGFDALKGCLKLRREADVVFAEAIPGAVEMHSTDSRFRYLLEKVGIGQ